MGPSATLDARPRAPSAAVDVERPPTGCSLVPVRPSLAAGAAARTPTTTAPASRVARIDVAGTRTATSAGGHAVTADQSMNRTLSASANPLYGRAAPTLQSDSWLNSSWERQNISLTDPNDNHSKPPHRLAGFHVVSFTTHQLSVAPKFRVEVAINLSETGPFCPIPEMITPTAAYSLRIRRRERPTPQGRAGDGAGPPPQAVKKQRCSKVLKICSAFFVSVFFRCGRAGARLLNLWTLPYTCGKRGHYGRADPTAIPSRAFTVGR